MSASHQRIAILGFGIVGQAMLKLFPEARIFDKYGPRQDDMAGCNIGFVAVPTPWNGNELDCSEVEDAIVRCPADLIVIRSTTNPGFADCMMERHHKRIVVQPEYLGESPSHPMGDMLNRPFLVLGGRPEDRREVINLYASVYNANIRIRQVTALEAEVIKISSNRAAFFKLMQCQELFDACEKAGIDYYTIRDAVYGDDPRFDLWWSFVHPDRRGADSKCIPKDIQAWMAWAQKTGADTLATQELLALNSRLVRSQHTA